MVVVPLCFDHEVLLNWEVLIVDNFLHFFRKLYSIFVYKTLLNYNIYKFQNLFRCISCVSRSKNKVSHSFLAGFHLDLYSNLFLELARIKRTRNRNHAVD